MKQKDMRLVNRRGHSVEIRDNGKSHIALWSLGTVLAEPEAKQLRDWLNAKYPVEALGAQAGGERAAFESNPAFVGMNFSRAEGHPEYYDSPFVNGAWEGWQARAAHGGEAVRKDAEAAYIEMTCQPVLIDGAHHYYLSSERMQAFDRLFSVDVSDAAMLAQAGEGEPK